MRGNFDTLQAENRLSWGALKCHFRGDGKSAKGWVHEVGMHADVAILWQSRVVISMGKVDALEC